MARILYPDGCVESLDVPASGLDLERMQTIVGGYIEVIALERTPHGTRALVINEDGRREELPHNAQASALFQAALVDTNRVALTAAIVGTAIECLIVDAGEDGERLV